MAGRPKSDPVSDSALLRMIDEEVRTGISFDTDSEKDKRSVALDYYDGVMKDLPAEKGRSQVVSRDVADVIDAMMPGLLRVFAGAGTLGVYEPARPGDEEFARQATDYVHHVLFGECGGYLVLLTGLMDGLQVRNGIVKAYWDPAPEHETEDLRGLDADQVTILLQDEGVELLGANPRRESLSDPATGQVVAVDLYDLRIRRVASNGRLVVDNVPPDDFGISAGAKSIRSARCVWHKVRRTRSDLIKEGYDREIVADLPAYGRSPGQADADRHETDRAAGEVGSGATVEIEIVEAYVFADRDGDGIAESRRVVTAGAAGGRKLLSDDPWNDDRPFVDLVPQPVPHRWMGRSPADDIMPLQRVKTALWRGALDNTYAQNFPDREVVETSIIDPDEVLSRGFGNRIRVKEPGAIRDITVPFVAANTLQAISAVDSLIQRRTGVSQATAALDATALDPQTATAETIEHDANYARVEMIARNIAELGLKPLFKLLLKIMVRNQDRPRTIRLRDKWVEFDPRSWNAAMDVSINVGLGTGSRERDLKMLSALYARQTEVYRELGPGNPVVTQTMIVATLHKIVEASGLKSPESYFADVSAEDFDRWLASRPTPPNPQVEVAQARLQADERKTQAQIEGAQVRQQAETVIDRERLAAELQMERERLEQEYTLKTEQMEREFALRRTEMESEAQLRAVAMATGGAGSVSTNIPRQ